MRFLRLFALIGATIITPIMQAQAPTTYQGGALPSPAAWVGRTIVASNSDANGNAGSGTYVLTSNGSTWTAAVAYQGGSLPSPAVMTGRTIIASNSDANGNVGSGTYVLSSNGATWSGVAVTSVSTGGGGTWGSITGTLSSQTDLQTALNGKQSTLTLPLSVSNGGTGTASPGIVAGTNMAVTGTWPNQTVSTSGLAASATTDATNAGNISSGLLAIARGGTGTATPALVAGTNVTITGTWPNQTINSSASGGSSTWNGITTPTANESLSMAAYTSTWTWGSATGASTNLFNLTDTTNNTGTGYLLDVKSQLGSAAGLIKIETANTTGIPVVYTATNSAAANAYFGVAGANYYPAGGAGGPGSAIIKADNDIILMAANTGRWYVSSSGGFKAAADNTYDIGASGANRPANVWVAKKVSSSTATGAVNTVASSATPTFDLSAGDFQTITMTANITSITLSNIVAGQRVVFDFVQDATGSRTVTYPATMHGATAPGTTASKHNVQMFYSPDGTNLYAIAAASTNQ